jgi:hypothetical protein
MSFCSVPPDILFSSSYVLSLHFEPYMLIFTMDFALTPEHSEYKPPDASEQECYRRGNLRIRGFRRVTWEATGNLPGRDATGETDYGNLDELTCVDGAWRLSGDWGVIELEGGSLSIELDQGAKAGQSWVEQKGPAAR